MNAVELRMPDGQPSGVWMCGNCRRLHCGSTTGDGRQAGELHRPQAEQCCDWRCDDCGAKARPYWRHCDACQSRRHREWERATDAERFAKAEKVAAAEWGGDCLLYDALADHWFQDLDEADEWYADDPLRVRPAHLWLSAPVDWSPDVAGCIGDRMCDHFHEDAAEEITKAEWAELEAFVAGWWERVKPASYTPDYRRCVLLARG